MHTFVPAYNLIQIDYRQQFSSIFPSHLAGTLYLKVSQCPNLQPIASTNCPAKGEIR